MRRDEECSAGGDRGVGLGGSPHRAGADDEVAACDERRDARERVRRVERDLEGADAGRGEPVGDGGHRARVVPAHDRDHGPGGRRRSLHGRRA